MMKAPWKVRRMCHQMILHQTKWYLDLLPHEDEEGVVDVEGGGEDIVEVVGLVVELVEEEVKAMEGGGAMDVEEDVGLQMKSMLSKLWYSVLYLVWYVT